MGGFPNYVQQKTKKIRLGCRISSVFYGCHGALGAKSFACKKLYQAGNQNCTIHTERERRKMLQKTETKN